jgi:hypothetical protein
MVIIPQFPMLLGRAPPHEKCPALSNTVVRSHGEVDSSVVSRGRATV